ncbi:hypothetical protein AA0119_g13045 [Alternaria tenuissima]|uniref:Uncharacterized protein n=1 Tax=Alternaria tenuissima TaxID=119927 RepID=A0ABY0FT58_9PLEO|nr:hypothetical protein AA0119_g13045 [Alternaria tenuissima]RYO23540.1 hypothetical protein AA0121_g2218 [Alternaria tenuissima]
MSESGSAKTFEAWSSQLSTQGHPTSEATEPKAQPWKAHISAEKRKGPTKGQALIKRSYDEDLSESNLGQ